MSNGKKRLRWQDKNYLKLVSELQCAVCGWFPPSDPHHIKGYSHITGSGGSRKGDDSFVIPLCHAHHSQLHQMGWKSWEKFWGLNQLDLVRETRSELHEYLKENYYVLPDYTGLET